MSIFLSSSPLDLQPIVDISLTGIGSACLAAVSVFAAIYGLGIIMKAWAETTGVNTGPKYDYADDEKVGPSGPDPFAPTDEDPRNRF